MNNHKEMMTKVIEEIKKFETENQGVVVKNIDFDMYGNVITTVTGKYKRISYAYNLTLMGGENDK